MEQSKTQQDQDRDTVISSKTVKRVKMIMLLIMPPEDDNASDTYAIYDLNNNSYSKQLSNNT